MTYRSVVRNFANIGIEQAQKLCEQLSLTMPAEMLQFCGKYYKNQLRRDPFVDELKMLDLLVSMREREGSSLAVTEFLTNDAFVARTYADLLKKRKQLWPEFSHPCTLGEAANVASDYICRARGIHTDRHPFLSLENVRDSLTYPDINCVAAKDSAYRMRLLPLAHTAISEADMLILMSPSSNDTQTVFRFKSAGLLRDKELMQYVKGVSTVGRGGILRELLNMTDGVLIQLSSLSPVGTSLPADVLCDGFLGCRILRVAPHQCNTVTTLLANSGVRALPFASIKREPQFVFVRDKESSFALDARFLRSLNRYQRVVARLADESTASLPPISFGGIGGKKCSYLTKETADQIGEVVEIGSTACAAAYAAPLGAYYQTALWTVLAPIAALCAHGVPYKEQSLAMALEIPSELTEETTVGNVLSTLLGLYRAQTELGIATSGRVSIRTDENLSGPALSVWTAAEDPKKVASTFSKSGSFVYAVSPALDGDGLPDFAALRQLFTQIAKLAKDGKILSCRTLAGEAITDGIRQMSFTHTCVLSDGAVAAEEKLPLCILIESEEHLPLRRIGKVHPFRRLPTTTVEIPESTDLIVNYLHDIVIVSSMMDNDAMALAAYLEENWWAHVSLFTNPEKEAVELSRAILTTQTLILCPNAKLPKTKYMDFALDTLRRAGGIFLSLSKKSTPEGFIPLKNGIDGEVLCKICPLIYKIFKKIRKN